MKRLIATTGGRPAKNEDFESFEQMIELVEKLCDDLSETLIVVSGCEYTSVGVDTWNVAAGYMYYNGNIYLVPTHVVLLPVFSSKFDADITDSTPRQHFDGSTKNTIQTHEFTVNASGAITYDSSTPRLSNWLTNRIDRGDGSSLWDFDETDLTINGSDHPLDLSLIIPSEARFVTVFCRFTATGTSGESVMTFKKNGNTYAQAQFRASSDYPTLWDTKQVTIAVDSNRYIEYNINEDSGVSSSVGIKVVSWEF